MTDPTKSSYLFERIVLDGQFERYAVPDEGVGERTIGPLAKINILVGANNTGKSRLMRLLAATEKITGYINPIGWHGIDEYLQLWRETSRRAQDVFMKWNAGEFAM